MLSFHGFEQCRARVFTAYSVPNYFFYYGMYVRSLLIYLCELL